MDNLLEKYSAEVESLSAKIKELRGKSRGYVVLEITSFCLAVAAFAVYCTCGMKTVWLLCMAAMLLAYALVRRADVLNDRKIKIMTKRRIVFSREVSCQQGDFSVFDDGARYADPQHAFTYDLDVFGRDSLFNRIDRTVTTGGSDELAASLSSLPQSVDCVNRRREAIEELSHLDDWRIEFLARGQRLDRDGEPCNEKTDTMAVLRIIKKVGDMRFPSVLSGRASLAAARLSLAGFYLCVVLSVFTSLPATVPFLWGIVQMFVAIGLTARPLREITKEADRLNKQMQNYVGLIRHIHAADFKSAELGGLYSTLFGSATDDNGGGGLQIRHDNDIRRNSALASFNELGETINRIDRRTNELALTVFNLLFLNDYFIVRGFLRWQANYMGKMSGWIDAVSRMDALVSMATMRSNHPEATAACVVDVDGVVFDADGLCHPFLGAGAVGNDFTVEDGRYYIITGANMAGKSTFLRSVGINYILAMNGMPVFADRLKVSLFNMFSSMRTSDDLSHGISYFNAELLRLRQLIESCKRHSHTLIILDEILKGTNSLDKLNGSRLFLTEMSNLRVSGIVATHDLELSKMADEHPSRFQNYCFEIQLAEDITYTYKISQGVARNQNATYLLGRMLQNVQNE